MSRQFVEPSAANMLAIVSSGSDWVNTAWVELIASTPERWWVSGLAYDLGSGSPSWELDIGIGTAGAEVVVLTFRGEHFTFGGDAGCQNPITLPILADVIPASSRVAMRFRKMITGGSATWRFALLYLKSITSEHQTTTQRYRPFPSAADPSTTLTQGVAWQYSAYTELIASTSTAIVITHIHFDPGSVERTYELELATGGAGAEVLLTRVRWTADNNAGGSFTLMLANPIRVPASTRLSWRHRRDLTTSPGTAISLSFSYLEEPL